MISYLFRLVFSLIFLCALVLFVGWMFRVSLLERALTAQLNSEVKVDDVHIGWGTLRIDHLRVKNTTSAFPYALECKEIKIKVKTSFLTDQVIHFQKIKCSDCTLYLEMLNFSGSENNWTSLLAGPEKKSSFLSRTFVIDHLAIVNLQIEAIRPPLKSSLLTVPIPYLEFRGIGSTDPLSLPQLVHESLYLLIQAVQSKQHWKPLINPSPSTSAPQTLRKSVKEGSETIKKKAEEVYEHLQKLFSR